MPFYQAFGKMPFLQAMKSLTLTDFNDDDSARLLAWLEAADRRGERRLTVQLWWRRLFAVIVTLSYIFTIYAGAGGWFYWRY